MDTERRTRGAIGYNGRNATLARTSTCYPKGVLLIAAPRATTPQPGLWTETVEERFRRLEAAWMAATGALSDDAEIVQHPAFREIVRMGEAVVPLMLRDLEQRPRLWAWALPEITGEDPVPAADRGHIAPMSEAWLRWGRAKGYRW